MSGAAQDAGCWRRIGVYGGDHSCPQLAVEIHCRNCAVYRDAARALLRRPLDPLPPLSSALSATRGGDVRSVLAFRLGAQWLGLPCDHIAEVAPAHSPLRIAHRGDRRVEGLVPVRGELHLCVALIEVLGLGHRDELAGDGARLVLLAPPQAAPIAFRASEVAGLRAVSSSEVGEVPATLPDALAACLAGIAVTAEGRLPVLAGQALMAALEQALYE
jgi:chemotaxis signal transduction protein